MAVKATDQISIVDVTDAYSVMLTSEAYTFVGDTTGAPSGQSCTTQVVAYCGTNRCSVVNVTASAITCPTGISASVSGSGSNAVTITFTTTATITAACEATIPVVVDGITVNKKFSFAIAKTGATGDAGEDAVTVSVTSSAGTVIKNSSGSTVLTAHVFKGGVEKTITSAGVVSDSLGTIKWYTVASGTETYVKSANSITVGASAGTGIDVVVTTVVAVTCKLEG